MNFEIVMMNSCQHFDLFYHIHHFRILLLKIEFELLIQDSINPEIIIRLS
jgi:hypothetical protein